MARPTRSELEAKRSDGTYLDFVKSQMADFCFTVDRHEGKEKVWFGSHTLSINRNIAFNFYSSDIRDDDGIEPYPVIRADAARIVDIRVSPDDDDPSAAYTVTAFYIDRHEYDDAIKSMDDVLEEYGDLRTLPDVWFPDAAVVRLVQRLLQHPRVKADREADWPQLL